jgi:hypothetical protein
MFWPVFARFAKSRIPASHVAAASEKEKKGEIVSALVEHG